MLANPFTVTTTFPVVAPSGTGKEMLVEAQLAGMPATPLNVTLLAPWTVPKFVPVIVTREPMVAEPVERLDMLGN